MGFLRQIFDRIKSHAWGAFKDHTYPNIFWRPKNEALGFREGSIYYQWKTEYGNTPAL